MNSINIKYYILQACFWGAAVVNYAYMTQILQEKGFSSVEIGILNCVKLFSSAVFQIWIGKFADMKGNRLPIKQILSVLIISTLVLTLIFICTGHNFLLMALISIGFGISFTTMSPLLDSLAMRYSAMGLPVNYEFGRSGGSLSWAVFCVLAGVYCDYFPMKWFPTAQLILMFIMLFILVSMKKDSVITEIKYNSASRAESHSVIYILGKYPAYTIFLFASMLMFMGYNLGATFLIDVIRNLGGSNFDYGLAQFVLAVSEIPSAFLIISLKKKVKVEYMMLCCTVFMAIKAALAAYADALGVIIGAQICEFPGLGLFYAGNVYLISKLLPLRDNVKATTMLSVAAIGLGEGIASIFCGVIREKFGLMSLMEISVVLNVLSVVFMTLMCFLIRADKKT